MSHPYTDAQVAALARFAGLVFATHRNDGYPGDVDGSEIERFAVGCGLLDKRDALAPCGGICVCHEFNGPGDVVCYFNTELGKFALDAARDGGGS